jgi:NADH:ubiquinone oxidoreductase subunit 6 (subunit J)
MPWLERSTTLSVLTKVTTSYYGSLSQAACLAVSDNNDILNRSLLLTLAKPVTLARFMYLNFDGNFCPAESKGGNSAAPGECYYYKTFSRYKIGILLHLAGILPASILVVLQFTPFIRHKWILVHRICGYAAILLYIVSLAGVFMILRRAFGGGLDVQSWGGFVGIGVLICFIISWINIKRLQIEQHRAWMLRGWFYVCLAFSTSQNCILILGRRVPSLPPGSS